MSLSVDCFYLDERLDPELPAERLINEMCVCLDLSFVLTESFSISTGYKSTIYYLLHPPKLYIYNPNVGKYLIGIDLY